MKHAYVKIDGFSVPMIGVPADATDGRCDNCGRSVHFQELVYDGRFLCRTCQDLPTPAKPAYSPAMKATKGRSVAKPTAVKSRIAPKPRGFAGMKPAKVTEIARKGGLTISQNRRHMANIGRIGGENSHKANAPAKVPRGQVRRAKAPAR